MLDEVAAGWQSFVSDDLNVDHVVLDDEEIRERMSGILCRCADGGAIGPTLSAACACVPATRWLHKYPGRDRILMWTPMMARMLTT